jgi:hypothetical protein
MIGKKLGPYQITEKLGEGGMGVVYKAHDTRLGRTVAINVLPPGAARDPERRRRFEQEARAVAALNHPHICTLPAWTLSRSKLRFRREQFCRRSFEGRRRPWQLFSVSDKPT